MGLLLGLFFGIGLLLVSWSFVVPPEAKPRTENAAGTCLPAPVSRASPRPHSSGPV